jgi:hypothetical protein
MEFTSVRVIDGGETKGVAEKEAELLANHEAAQLAADESAAQAAAQAAAQTAADYAGAPNGDEQSGFSELKEEDVLSYIGKRYNKQINSFDELMAERSQAEEMPEDVAAYMKYKKETGRGFEDFIKLKEDFDTMDSDKLLKRYLHSTQEGLDSDDIESLMEDYTYDEDLDDESTVKKVKIARKKVVAEAKKFFNEQKEKYKMPLESSTAGISDSDREELNAYKQYMEQAKTIEEENNRKRQWFDQKTNEVFSNEFKGFEFDVNNRKLTFSPGDAVELRRNQSTPQNFIQKFLDDSGLIKDAAGYHRALSIAMNPDKFAKFFYEQGMSDATDDVTRKIKNVNMSERRAIETSGMSGGMQVRAVNPESGRNLKIRSIKKL